MKTLQQVFISLFVVTSLLLAGCQNNPQPVTPETSLLPTASPDVTPKPSDILLSYPDQITLGETLFVEVINQGNISYVFYRSEGDNCLSITSEDAEDHFFPTVPLTCDVLTFNVVHPGERQLLGSWDLTMCKDSDCLQRSPAPPGNYVTTAVFYPFSGDVSQIDASTEIETDLGIKRQAVFTLTQPQE
ncbi:MAG: hypothetical protein CL608_09225 [Anaerolineaceae bacterium]|nr:hypothetical protein [Anaerolineaceae bacterium]